MSEKMGIFVFHVNSGTFVYHSSFSEFRDVVLFEEDHRRHGDLALKKTLYNVCAMMKQIECWRKKKLFNENIFIFHLNIRSQGCDPGHRHVSNSRCRGRDHRTQPPVKNNRQTPGHWKLSHMPSRFRKKGEYLGFIKMMCHHQGTWSVFPTKRSG